MTLINSFIDRFFPPKCQHKWEVLSEYGIGVSWRNAYHTIIHVMKCSKCGELKNHKTSVRS